MLPQCTVSLSLFSELPSLAETFSCSEAVLSDLDGICFRILTKYFVQVFLPASLALGHHSHDQVTLFLCLWMLVSSLLFCLWRCSYKNFSSYNIWMTFPVLCSQFLVFFSSDKMHFPLTVIIPPSVIPPTTVSNLHNLCSIFYHLVIILLMYRLTVSKIQTGPIIP